MWGRIGHSLLMPDMAKYLFLICLSMSYLPTSHQKSTPDARSYRGAVVEYSPLFKENDSKSTLQQNVDSYIHFIQEAGKEDVDIIVFPEDGLTTIHLPDRAEMDEWSTLIPAPSENYIPCDRNDIPVSEALKNISCAAKESNVYVVINIAEKYPCSGQGCPDNKALYYNSNVAFNRQGMIVARYRKTHLFYEKMFNTTPIPEVTMFETDFGVKFGMFICFDILFKEPALNLTRTQGITDILYSTAWFSETPFLTAVQFQMGWAYAENVNLLASGYNNPSAGNAGSGIYLGDQNKGKRIFPRTSESNMLVHDIPKKQVSEPVVEKARYTSLPKHHIHDELRRKRSQDINEIALLREDISKYITEFANTSITKNLCHGMFCCNFRIEMESIDPTVMYRIVSFKGMRQFGPVNSEGVAACAVIQCSNDSITSCGSVLPSTTKFKVIEISGKFDNYPESLVVPSTLNANFMPLTNFHYDTHRHENHAHIHISLSDPTNDIATFGIYARHFKQ